METKKSFTIIEFIAVISIITIITSVSIISWAPISALIKLNSEGDKIISILWQAQQSAVTEQINFAVRFRKNNNSYSLIRLEPDLNNPEIKTVLEMEKYEIAAPILIKSVEDFTNDQAEFSSFGSAVSAGEIMLEDQNGREYAIEVTAAGRIRKK